ncbi:hypothetical protein KAI92_03165 [Candidatus Parcubacteria bacterium]|nr:hypothetical protein [Candidatus Parcubacteria bacterium]
MKRILFFVAIMTFAITSLAIIPKANAIGEKEVPTIDELLQYAKTIGIEVDTVQPLTSSSPYGYDGSKKVGGVTVQGKKGYFPWHIARDFSNADYRTLLEENGLSVKDAKSLPESYKFFIPWEMLKKEFRNPLPKLLLSQAEISKLQEQLEDESFQKQAFENQISSLKSELELEINDKKEIIEKQKKEKTIKNGLKENGDLIIAEFAKMDLKTNQLLEGQKLLLEGQEVIKQYKQYIALIVAAMLMAFVVIFLGTEFVFRSYQKTSPRATQ